MENRNVIVLLKYYHLFLGSAGLVATIYNMVNAGSFAEYFSSLLSSILFIVIAFRITLLIHLFKNRAKYSRLLHRKFNSVLK